MSDRERTIPPPRIPGENDIGRCLAAAAAVIVGSMAAAVAYGIPHDLVTAHLCVEYFTIGHVNVLGTDDPVVLGLFWGVAATWWVGLILGALLALASQAGGWPRRPARRLVRPLALLLLTSALVAAVAGGIGNALARTGVIWLLEPLASAVPAEQHVPFLTAAWMHVASYATCAVGGIGVCVHTIVVRGRLAVRANGV